MIGLRQWLEPVRTVGALFLREVALLNGLLVWIGFWGQVVRLHARAGDLMSAVVTGGLFVLPAVLALAWHIGSVCAGTSPLSAHVPRPLSE